MEKYDVTPLLAHTLGNGFQVVGQALPDVQSLAVCYYVRTGSRAEECPMMDGIAHALEHMLFKTTQTRSGLELIQAFQRIGLEVNACTCTDATIFYACGLSDSLEQVIALLSEMLFPLLQEEEFETEKGAILSELLQQQEEPESMLRHSLREVYFAGRHTLAHDGLGTPESVRTLQVAQLRHFWETYYAANNVIVSVVGNVREDHLITCLERSCGTWQPRKVPRSAPFTYLPDLRTRVVVNPSLRQQFLALAVPVVPKEHPRYLATLVGASILEERLFWVLVQSGLAENSEVNIWSDGFDVLRGIGILSIETNTTPQTAPRVLGLIQHELVHLLQDGITEAELLRKKRMLARNRLLGYEEDRLFRAWELAEQWDCAGHLLSIEEELACIEQVGREEVVQALHHFPWLERHVLAALGPLSQEALTMEWITGSAPQR